MRTLPLESDIQQVMRETGMGRMQAINHLRAREQSRYWNQQRALRYPLGKSSQEP
jgi:hypothetical protein